MTKRFCFLFIIGIIVIGWGCESPALKQHEGNEYYYYPAKNVYYDVSRHHYIFSLDSGKTWDSLASEAAVPAIEGKRQVIYSSSSEVWLNNEMHREEYGGTLLNIINEQSLKVTESHPKKSMAKITEEENTGSEKKERKRPIKRFFQKIFGKKKD